MDDKKVTQTETTQDQQQDQTQQQDQQQDQQQTVDMKTYLELVSKMEKMEQMLSQEAEKQKEIEAKQQELWQKEVKLALKEAGLEQFASIVKVSDEKELNETIKTLTQIVNNIKVSTGYIPADHAKTDEYSKYEKEKNVAGMIAVKLSKLFHN
ncbi:hypothetical protein [Geobacillus sp. B4113_201601]|uniref:hypothetical protein n=1 Tax=Geobacillus sp. B4113_201601 TaxID=1586290 RepID=UPI0007857190|nr:hypothetical protein [Geobacillus sp. B4113_201601]KYD26214.1 hypothetical protein B4113_1315 [Geobacillus sp. B4113_201601]